MFFIPRQLRENKQFDFPLNAPVIFDVIDPITLALRRILAHVKGIRTNLQNITGEPAVNDLSYANNILVGSQFRMYVQTRSEPHEWISIHLEVTDIDYDDGLNSFDLLSIGVEYFRQVRQFQDEHETGNYLLSKKQVAGSRDHLNIAEDYSHYPIPVGMTSIGDPYFAPPVNFPHIPSGYTKDGKAYYGRTPSVQIHPLGVTDAGIRFYSAEGKLLTPDTTGRFITGGYSYDGTPFYIPRGLILPSPAGFTTDGIAFYDIPSMLATRDPKLEPFLPNFKRLSHEFPEFETEESKIDKLLASQIADSKVTEYVTAIIKTIAEDYTELLDLFNSVQLHSGKMERESREKAKIDEFTSEVKKNSDVIELLSNIDQFSHLKVSSMRITVEPLSLNFQSVNLSVHKTFLIRYKAARGDRELKDFYLSTRPSDVFSLKTSHVALQGEGVVEIEMTFNPKAMKSEKVEGTFSLIDDTGKCMTYSKLYAVRQSFFSVFPQSLDGGWVAPEKMKTVSFKVTNISNIQISLNVGLETDRKTPDTSLSGLKNKDRPFDLGRSMIKLLPHESTYININCLGNRPGQFSEVVEVSGTGGDIFKVKISFTCGVPVVIFPESLENSKAGADALSRERSSLLKKFTKTEHYGSLRYNLSSDDRSIIQTIMASTADFETRKKTQCLDFGVFPVENSTQTRCITLFNLSDTTQVIGLFSRNKAVSCNDLVRISSKSAISIDINLTINTAINSLVGNFETCIDFYSSDFVENSMTVTAFIGQPLYFPVWDIVCIRPCATLESTSIEMNLMNESHYPITARFNPTKMDAVRKSSFSCSLEGEFMIEAFSTIPVTFSFEARDPGPYMELYAIDILAPNKTTINAAHLNKQLRLCSGCVCPQAISKESLKGIDFLTNWMSHPQRIVNDYPKEEDFTSLYSNFDPSNKKISKDLLFDEPKVLEMKMPGNVLVINQSSLLRIE
jgi:hypothetical protein